MMEATITHNGLGESLTFPIMEESGSPLFSVDIGKPELNIYENGELQPRFLDTRSLIENYSITSQLTGPSAYADAIQLADIIKSRTGDNGTLTVELNGTNIPDAYPTSPTTVAPAAEQERAVEFTYSPGRKNVSLTLDFQGLFGLGSFNVIPDGSQAFRYQRVAGQKDVENAPTLSLRRVI